ncbi:MAG TPA: hypothetical protein VG652_00630, partial [Gaiellaceae bacterium]|nr:hypothetical protein [Gaiellaceae bacterium]
LDRGATPTNMVILTLAPELMSPAAFVDELAKHGVRGYVSRGNSVRFVTHRHITDEGILRAAAVVASIARATSTS